MLRRKTRSLTTRYRLRDRNYNSPREFSARNNILQNAIFAVSIVQIPVVEFLCTIHVSDNYLYTNAASTKFTNQRDARANKFNERHIEQRCIFIHLARLNNRQAALYYNSTVYLATSRDVGKKSARISRINRTRTWESRWNGQRSYRKHFSSLPLSISLSLSLFAVSFRVTFHHYPSLSSLNMLSYPVLQLYRSGRGCSDPRRRSSESWVVATSYLLSFPFSPLLPHRSPSSGKLSTFFTGSRFYLPAAPRN